MIGDPGALAERALREGLPDRRARVGNGHPLDGELAEGHLELLHDLRPLVGSADDRAELARLVVLELDDRGRLLVVRAPEPVDLALALVVEDHGQPAPVRGEGRVFDADAWEARFTELAGHLSLLRD